MSDRTRIIFYGGCTGINKSETLKNAVLGFGDQANSIEIIKISEYFLREMTEDDWRKKSTIWKESDWKKHEDAVVDKLGKKIKNMHNLFIINNHFSTISPSGYIPGLDMDNLETLLKNCCHIEEGDKRTKKEADKPAVGVLLIDTNLEVIYNHYKEMLEKLVDKQEEINENIKFDNKYKINNAIAMLPYISGLEIEKDLRENRAWAEAYSLRARSIFPHGWVKTKTIYQREGDLNMTKKNIENFIREFMD
jgi:hypothetical protein